MSDFEQNTTKVIEKIIAALGERQKWILACHENPDGDTIGCSLALYSLGKRLGKEVRVTGKSLLPERYFFLPFADAYKASDFILEADKFTAIVCVDTSTEERSIGGLAEASKRGAVVINIDHHGDNRMLCDLSMVNPNASATAEVVVDIFMSSEWKITKDEANLLYLALVTDNGNFRFSSTTEKSHKCAATLMSFGAVPSFIDEGVNENMTASVLRLWGLALSRTESFAGGVCAVFWLTQEEIESAHADAASIDGLVNMLLRVKGVKAAALFSCVDGQNKASVRTKTPYSAREIVSVFGGGGHPQAAGTKIQGDFYCALTKLKAEMEKHVAKRNTSNR